MDANLVKIKIQNRLNKLASGAYANIEDADIIEVINKAALEWVRKQIHGVNVKQEGDEESRMRIDDIQILLKDKALNINKKNLFCESSSFPDDYGWFKSVLIYGKKGECEDLMRDVHLIEEANANEWLSDWSKKPSFEFRQCFYTLFNNKLKIYTNNEFEITKVLLIYYRLPNKYALDDVYDVNNNLLTKQDLEFKEDVCEIIIDEAVTIIAGDIENVSAYQTSSKRKEENN